MSEGRRELFEFYCNDCQGYILVNINVKLDKHKVVVVCPSCKREHPRTFQKGEMISKTDEKYSRYKHDRLIKDEDGLFSNNQDRYTKGEIMATRNYDDKGNPERIIPMKSAYSKERRLDKVSKPGYLTNLWVEKAEREKHG